MIVEIRLVIDEDAVVVASNGLQESRAARAGRAKDDQHFALADKTVEVAQNVDPALPVPGDPPHQADGLEPDVDDILLVIGGGSETVDVEVLEGNAAGAEVMALSGDQTGHGLGPGAGAEVGAVGVQRRRLVLRGNGEHAAVDRARLRLGRILARESLNDAVTALLLNSAILVFVVIGGRVGSVSLLVSGDIPVGNLGHRGRAGPAELLVSRRGRSLSGKLVFLVACRLSGDRRSGVLGREIVVPEGTTSQEGHGRSLQPVRVWRRLSGSAARAKGGQTESAALRGRSVTGVLQNHLHGVRMQQLRECW